MIHIKTHTQIRHPHSIVRFKLFETPHTHTHNKYHMCNLCMKVYPLCIYRLSRPTKKKAFGILMCVCMCGIYKYMFATASKKEPSFFPSPQHTASYIVMIIIMSFLLACCFLFMSFVKLKKFVREKKVYNREREHRDSQWQSKIVKGAKKTADNSSVRSNERDVYNANGIHDTPHTMHTYKHNAQPCIILHIICVSNDYDVDDNDNAKRRQ